jgi:predicted metal-dependent phosphotriesterase family hydrolase
LVDAGYGHRIMLSHDANMRQHRSNEAEREQRRLTNPDGYLFVKRRVLTRLLELGVSEEAIRVLNEDNARTFFS